MTGALTPCGLRIGHWDRGRSPTSPHLTALAAGETPALPVTSLEMIWTPQETTVHQDHVIAHVIGATVLGHFVFDESIYLLLDIGFFWRAYLDGEMGLLPTAVTIHELEMETEIKAQLESDCDRLAHGSSADLEQMSQAPVECLIQEVVFLTNGDDWRLLLHGEQNDLAIEASILTRSLALFVP